MAHFLFQWRYKDPAIKAMLEMPQDRPRELRKAVEGCGRLWWKSRPVLLCIRRI